MSKPLKGIKVLDFSTLLPGPYATQLLADMGAEVLRIESPTRPDLLKVMPPFVDGVSAAHATINRNKKSLAIDLKHGEAKDIVIALLNEYDVVIEQFRPGVMKRLGLDYESLKTVQPRLIFCSITGYGQTGPLKDRAGHDINYLALSGLASYSGREETGPCLSATQIADVAGGSHHAVMSILAAIIERQSSGLGQYLDISMTDAAFALNTMFGANALQAEVDPHCGTEMLNGGMFYDYYKTADNRYISIGSLEPNFAAQMLQIFGLTDWMSKIVNTSPSIQRQLKEAIKEKVESESLDYWVSVFATVDACVEPVLTINEAAQSEQLVSRGMITEVRTSEDKLVKQINTPLPFKSSEKMNVGHSLGEDTISILGEIGYAKDNIQALIKSKCIKGS